MKVAIGSDINAIGLKEELISFLQTKGVDVVDCGINGNEDVDYPDIAKNVADKILSEESDRGILLCGTGIGMALAANKVKGIRAAQVSDTYSAERAELSNRAQIITLGAKVIGSENAKKIVSAYLNSEFSYEGSGKNSARKINKIMKIENDELKG